MAFPTRRRRDDHPAETCDRRHTKCMKWCPHQSADCGGRRRTQMQGAWLTTRPESSEASNVPAAPARFDTAVRASPAPFESRSAAAVSKASTASWTACTCGCSSAPAEALQGVEVVLDVGDRRLDSVRPFGDHVDVLERFDRGRQLVPICAHVTRRRSRAAGDRGAWSRRGSGGRSCNGRRYSAVAVVDESSSPPHAATRAATATPATTQRTIHVGLGFIESPLLVECLDETRASCGEIKACLRLPSSRRHGR